MAANPRAGASTVKRARAIALCVAGAGAVGLIAWAWPRRHQELEPLPSAPEVTTSHAAGGGPATPGSATPARASASGGESGSGSGTGAIPPGHTVVVFSPSPEARVDTSNAGMVICNLGRGGDRGATVSAMIEAAGSAMRRNPTTVGWIASTTSLTDIFKAKESALLRVPSSVVWILQSGSLDGLDGWVEEPEKLQALLRKLYRVMAQRSGSDPQRFVVVIADDRWKNARAVITLIQELDLATHRLGYQQTALVEVKRPDGSYVVGVPGAPYERLRGDDARILDWNREKDKAEAEGDAGRARLRSIEQREQAYIADILKRGGGEAAPDASIENRRLRSLIGEVKQRQGFDRQRTLYSALLEESTLLYVSSFGPSAERPTEVGPDVAVRSIEHPNLGRVVVAFTDSNAWKRAKLDGDQPLAISGRKLFAYAMASKQGVLINHAGPDLVGIVGPTLEALASGELPTR